MIRKKTVFILGAGASVPYGFPTGAKLKSDILEDIRVRGTFTSSLISVGYHEVNLNKFAHDFSHSARKSIDAFLEHNPHCQEIGKLYIANFISRCEHPDLILNSKRHWYQELYNNICGSSLEDILNSKISFVTFNYDRSFKFFLFNALKYSFNKSDEEVSSVLNKIPIIHVHGAIGSLPWESSTGVFVKSYKSKNNLHEVENASKLIKVIHESDPTTDEFKKAQDLVKDSENLIFMGFGFHSENLNRLNVLEYSKDKKIFMDYMGPPGDIPFSIQKKLGRAPVDQNYKGLSYHWITNDSLGVFEYFNSLIFD